MRKLVAILLVAGAGLSFGCDYVPPARELPRGASAGAWNPATNVELVGPGARPYALSQLAGRPSLLFFGYTYCPDACPATLSKVARVLDLVGDGPKPTTVFISIDPARDTPARLEEYLEWYGYPAVGLTGSREQLEAAARPFGAYFKKVEGESAAGYLMQHTTMLFLLDGEGNLRRAFLYDDPAEEIAGAIRSLD